MSQDKTIKGVMERFREKYTPEWWLGFCSDYSSNSRGIDSIEQFIQQEIKLALESQKEEILEYKNPFMVCMGKFNECEHCAVEEFKENIKHYLE